MLRRLRGQRGFTLIEMMVVLAIIALIAVFAIPNITNALQNSRIKSVEAQARQIQNAFDQYYNDNNTYPNAPATTAGTGTDDADYDNLNGVLADEAYIHFFGATSTTNPEGKLKQYVSLPATVDAALFIPVAYAVIQGSTTTTPAYELILEVKNVNTDAKYIHITKTGVTRSSDDGRDGNPAVYDTTATHTDKIASTGITASWVKP